MKKNNLKFDFSHKEVLGCSLEELEKHLTDQFTKGMNMDNYGKWEVDHIKPVSKFDFMIRDNFFKCFNYKNLQPLWKEDNMKKSNKYFE